MTLAEVAVVVGIVATGLFTGLTITFQVVIQRVLRPLSGPEDARTMQAVTRATDQPPTAPAIVLLGVLAPIVTLVRLRADAGSAAFRLTLVGRLVFTVGALVVTVSLNAPINRRVLGWSPEAPPAD